MKKETPQLEIIESLQFCIDDEGLDYAIQHKSSWKELKDEEFHRLRQYYIDAAKELEEYIETL